MLKKLPIFGAALCVLGLLAQVAAVIMCTNGIYGDAPGLTPGQCIDYSIGNIHALWVMLLLVIGANVLNAIDGAIHHDERDEQ